MKSNTDKRTKHDELPRVFAKNLNELIEQQKRQQKEIPLHLRATNASVKFFGSHWFLWLNVIAFILWILMNVGIVTLVKPFDPYPFEFLTMSVSLEAIVLSVIVLIAQNKLQNDSDERAALDLQINLLAESEATLNLKKLARIEKHLGIDVDEDEEQRVEDLTNDTHPEKLAEVIHDSMSKNNEVSL